MATGRALIDKIDRLYARDDLQTALGLLTQALDQQPDAVALLRRRARVAADLGHRKLALSDLEKLIEFAPHIPDFWIWKSQLQKDFYRGLGILERALRRIPGHRDLLIAKAHHFSDGKRYDEAVDVMTRALAASPDDPDLWLVCADLRRRRVRDLPGDLTEAERARQFVTDMQAAVADVTRAIELAPSRRAHALRADLLRSLKRDAAPDEDAARHLDEGPAAPAEGSTEAGPAPRRAPGTTAWSRVSQWLRWSADTSEA